jgi:hypothetical protein
MLPAMNGSIRPWRVEPGAGGLEAGDACRVGIPPTWVIVREVRSYVPAKDVGWLPRPVLGLSVVAAGDEGDKEADYLVYLDSAEPVSATGASARAGHSLAVLGDGLQDLGRRT